MLKSYIKTVPSLSSRQGVKVMSGQGGSGLGGAAGTFVGIGLLYWFGLIAGIAMLISLASFVLLIALALAAIYGAFTYIVRAKRAVSSGNSDVAFSLIVAPMLAPAGILVGLFLTEVVNVGTFTDFIGYYESTPGKEFLVAIVGFIYAMWLWFGWLLPLTASYTDTTGEARHFASLLWFLWGFGWAMALGWSYFFDLIDILFG